MSLQRFGSWLSFRPAVSALLVLSSCACSEKPTVEPAPETAGETPPLLSAALQDNQERNPQRKPRAPILPRVTLDGKSHHLSVAQLAEGPRVYARDLRTWIHEEPSSNSRRIGYMRAGSSSPTEGGPRGTRGCQGGWYSVEPEGFVCVGERATLDPKDPIVRLFEHDPPRTETRLPYRYGTVRKPGALYGRLPKLAELPEAEPDFDRRYQEWLTIDGEVGASFRQDIWEWGKPPVPATEAWEKKLSRGIPEFLAQGNLVPSPTGNPRPNTLVLDRMEPRVGHAFLETFFAEGRRYGLSTHLEIAPLDRYRPIEGSDFHGVEIGKDVDFPFAFVRRIASKYSDGSVAEYRDVLPLTGKKKFLSGRLHYETTDGKYISDEFASELTLAKSMPGWANKGEKWISISLNKQTLVLYEGTRPVYATLVSSGEAGLEDPEHTTATKRGIFRVHTKHITSTMSSNEIGEEFELRDVPYVQYFAEGGFALHGAYWHDRFGTPKSHGCINLAPEDARRIFFWTDPPVPAGWHAALSPLEGTVVFIHP